MKKLQLLFVLSGALTLGACGGGSSQIVEGETDPKPISGAEESTESIAGKENKDGAATGVEVIGTTEADLNGQGLEGTTLTPEEIAQQEAEMMAQAIKPVVYFGYDQVALAEEANQTIKHYADYLLDHPTEKLTLTGHTDERGTPEYNLALGEKRAQSVEELFMLYGVNQSRIDVITMGEEMPAIDEETEAAWSKNRRVEINIYE